MVDIHTHIFYGVDDGPDNIDVSMKMLEQEWKDGVDCILLTPHYGPKFGYPDRKMLERKFIDFKKYVKQQLPDMELYLGSEIYYEKNSIQDLKDGKALSLNYTKYVLIEFDYSESYMVMLRGIQDFSYAGYIPIIAHIEKYTTIFGKIKKVEELINAGAYIQVNMDSFLGGILNKRTSFVKKLLKYDLIHFIASDCHDIQNRAPNIGKGKEIIEKRAELTYFENNAKEMIAGKYI